MDKIKIVITILMQIAMLALSIVLVGPTVESLTSQSLDAVIGAFVLVPALMITLIITTTTSLAQVIVYAFKKRCLFVALQAAILAASIYLAISFYTQAKI